ncbi:helix-turn-helix domain-containing protein [Georgenia yuyongxinii]
MRRRTKGAHATRPGRGCCPRGRRPGCPRPGRRPRPHRRRPRWRRLDTYLEIHEAALELFESQGIRETTVQQIADRARVSPRTFFRYFTTKE